MAAYFPKRIFNGILIGILSFSWLPALAMQAGSPPTFTVNSLADLPAGGDLANGVCQTAADNTICTLRAAVMKANHYPGGGATIRLPANPAAYPITIPQATPNNETNGDLDLTQSMMIQGSGAAVTLIQANMLDRIFRIAAGAVITLSGVTLSGGFDDLNALGGGAIYNQGTLFLSDSRLRGDRSQRLGGGLWNSGTAAVSGTWMDGNTSDGDGGGIYNQGTLTLRNSAITGSIANGVGGGIANTGQLAIDSVTIADNQTENFTGGGINNTGTLQMINTTLSNNSAVEQGGGIYNNGTATAAFSTIAGNLANNTNTSAANTGGGIFNAPLKTFNLRASLLAWNYQGGAADDCSGDPINSQDYNFVQTQPALPNPGFCFLKGATGHNRTGAEPGLDGPGSNGGPQLAGGGALQTRALLPGSPAIDAIPADQCYDLLGRPLPTDERGRPRPAGAACDIGSFEGLRAISLLGENLIQNGNGEMSAGSPNGTLAGLPYWTTGIGQPSSATYAGYWPSHLGFPILASPGPADRGYTFFLAWSSSTATAYQRIDVSALAASIDAGKITYRLAGYFGGIASQDDLADAFAAFYDSQNNAVSSPAIGNIRASDRGNQSGLLFASTEGVVPAGTRMIEIDLNLMEAVGSTNNGACADNLALVLNSTNSAIYLPVVIH